MKRSSRSRRLIMASSASGPLREHCRAGPGAGMQSSKKPPPGQAPWRPPGSARLLAITKAACSPTRTHARAHSSFPLRARTHASIRKKGCARIRARAQTHTHIRDTHTQTYVTHRHTQRYTRTRARTHVCAHAHVPTYKHTRQSCCPA